MEIKDAITHLQALDASIHENIRLADTKAAWIASLDTALLGVFVLSRFKIPTDHQALTAVAYMAAACFALGTVFAAAVIRPRGFSRQRDLLPRSLVAPEAIPRRGRGRSTYACEFVKAGRLNESLEAKFAWDLARLVHVRAETNNAKYQWLIASLYVSVFGWLLAGAVVLVAEGWVSLLGALALVAVGALGMWLVSGPCEASIGPGRRMGLAAGVAVLVPATIAYYVMTNRPEHVPRETDSSPAELRCVAVPP